MLNDKQTAIEGYMKSLEEHPTDIGPTDIASLESGIAIMYGVLFDLLGSHDLEKRWLFSDNVIMYGWVLFKYWDPMI